MKIIKLGTFLIGLLFFCGVQAQDITTGLAGYWPFTGDAGDSSGNSNHGKVTGATLTTDRFGNSQSAYYFDGNGDYIDVGNDASLRSSEHSVNFWFKYINTSKEMRIVNNHNGNSGEWGVNCFHTIPNGLQYTVCAGPSNRAMAHASYKTLADDKWHMWTSTYDKSTNIITLYLDGCLSGYKNLNGTAGAFNSNDSTRHLSSEHWVFGASAFYFSSTPNNGPLWYTGSLDDVRLYNRALDVLDVQKLFYFGSTVMDTTHVVVYDTIDVYDTTYVNIYDTTYVDVYDTTYITVFDTTYINVFDTMYVTIFDTTHVTHYDTVHVAVYDTTWITVMDTMTINIFDTTFTSVTDTLFVDIGKDPQDTSKEFNVLKVYPNPASKKVLIDLGDYFSITGYKVLLYNVVGQRLDEQIVNGRFMEFNIENLARGHYQLVFTDQNEDILTVKRLVLR